MTRFAHKFTDRLPPVLESETLYVSMACATVVHLCACGCGRKVVTPLSPGDWRLTFDGKSLTLSPSIGNWQYPCWSHYWIRSSRIEWAFDTGRHTNPLSGPSDGADESAEKPNGGPGVPDGRETHRGLWRRLYRRWRW